MARLPVLSGRELVRLLSRVGFRVVRQRGSHVSMQKDQYRTLTSPVER